MKDIVAFLLAYPLWVKIVVICLLATCLLLLVVFKPEPTKEQATLLDPSPVVSVRTNVGCIVAGRDVVFNAAAAGIDTQELIRIVEMRAEKIVAELSGEFRYVPVQKYLTEFEKLHMAHVNALRRGNLIEAHEVLGDIHSLSRRLQSDEFWTRHRKETPNVSYSLNLDAFLRGAIIERYAGRDLMEVLVTRQLHPRQGSTTRENVEQMYQRLDASA